MKRTFWLFPLVFLLTGVLSGCVSTDVSGGAAGSQPSAVSGPQVIESEKSDLARYYDNELLQWDYSGLEGLKLNLQDESSSVNIWLKNHIIKDALMHYPDSNQQFGSYKWKSISGAILSLGGLAAIVVGSCVPIFSESDGSTRNFNMTFGFLLGGFAMELIGGAMGNSGQRNLFNAVKLYNNHKIDEFSAKPEAKKEN
jgi:hypothetical protein